MAAAPSVLVPIADGSEEIEAVCIIDTLRRAGANVVVASVEAAREVVASRRTRLVADVLLSELGADARFDLVALPGGIPGAERLRDCAPLVRLLRAHAKEGRPYAAICAAPAVVLATHGLLDSVAEATCYPAPRFLELLPKHIKVDERRVVVSGNVITSRGPGTAIEFALALVQRLFGEAKRLEVGGPMLVANL